MMWMFIGSMCYLKVCMDELKISEDEIVLKGIRPVHCTVVVTITIQLRKTSIAFKAGSNNQSCGSLYSFSYDFT